MLILCMTILLEVKMTKKKLLVKFLFGSVVMMLTLVFSVNVNALSSEEIFTRILVNNFQYCYQNALTPRILAKNYTGFDSLMNDGFKNSGASKKNGIRIPDLNDSYNKITAQSLEDKGRLTSCYALLYRINTAFNGNMKGLLDIYKVDVPTNSINIDLTRGLLADKLKYITSTKQASSNEYCYTAYVRPKTTVDSSVNLGTYCRNEDNYPITINDKIVFTGGSENSNYVATGKIITAVANYDTKPIEPLQITITQTKEKCEPKKVYCSATVAYSSGVPTEGVKKATPNDQYWTNQPDIYVEVTKKVAVGNDSRNLLFNKRNSNWKEALSAITGGAYTDEVPFSDAEKYVFYKQYLTTYYSLGGVPLESSVCQADKPSMLADVTNAKYYIFVKNSGWCLANLSEERVGQTNPMTVFTNDQRYRLNRVIYTLSELINLMGELDYDNMGEIPDVDPESPVVDPDNPTKATCANSGGAESLGWIVCPILSWMGRASNDLYDYYIKPALNVKPALFDEGSGENDDVKDAWGIFQNIANIVFVILFLLVIFSQLTGVGIDNYGIKKILPKLIIVAILVNISYYICLIFIDLSNIVGNGIQNMFNWMSSSLTINDAVIGEENIGSEILSTSVTGAALLGALVLGGVAVWQNPAILLTLLISGLGVVISILFLFLILSAREAAIVILTVISPLAFVCYMLPNTKNLFDRWRKMGEGLLLVYPICGLLVGGGSYVSKLLLASGIGTGDGSNGFFGVFSAMLISVVPIFFIPTVLRNSFAAMGNLGAKISGFGERLRGGATRGMRNTNAFKQAQERGLERRTRIRAGYDSKGNKKNLGALGRFMRGGRRNMQRESLRYQKMISDRGSLEATEGDDFMLATETANEMKNIVASGEINDMGLMQRSLELALESGNRARIRAYTDGLTAKGEDGRKAVKAAYNAAVSSHRMSTVSAQTFANNIMANHAADYKNNNRSMFEVARNINTAANTAALSAAASTTTDSYVGANNANLAGKVTATTIGNMDDDAFEEMFGGYNGNPVTIPAGASANEIGAAAYAALNDQNANIKAERRKHLEALVESSGYQAKAQNVQEAGIYADSAGRTYRIRRTLDGKYIDDAGFEVDISRLNPR